MLGIKNTDKLNQAKKSHGLDIYLMVIRQNRALYFLILTVFIGYSCVFVILATRPVPVLMVDEEGRYVAKVIYTEGPALDEKQLEAAGKRFVQHFLSQNSATIYEDAAISLAAMCQPLRESTHQQWVAGGKLARVVERVQVSRMIFSEFVVLKYLTADDIQIEAAGRIIISDDDRGDSGSDFRLRLALKLVPLTSRNYLGIEICDIQFL